jgi:glucosamine 6-phosphate synthetase-like amidotransferase/phosphosugar isomerase protein
MCGIIGYIGKKEQELPALLANAQFNVHRGDDGVGVIYNHKGKMVVDKKLFSLEELNEKKLNDDFKTEVKIGDIITKVPDKKTYDKKQSIFETSMEKFHSIKSNVIFLHHRKGTVGSDAVKNLHPIEVGGNYYMHNGTVYNLEPIKKWLELNTNVKFKTEVDTEIIVTLYQELKKQMKGDTKNIFDCMKEMFPYGWGVIIEFTPNGEITIIKDDSRTLWVYLNDEDGLLLISEPTPLCNDFDSVILLNAGIYSTKDLKGKDYTTECKRALVWWNASDNIDHNTEIKKCETCSETKNTVITFHCDGHPDESSRNEICFNCLVTGVSKESSEMNQQEYIREMYSLFIGDLE